MTPRGLSEWSSEKINPLIVELYYDETPCYNQIIHGVTTSVLCLIPLNHQLSLLHSQSGKITQSFRWSGSKILCSFDIPGGIKKGKKMITMLRLSPDYWAWQRIIVTQPTLPDSMEILLDPKLVAFPRFMTKFDLLWRNACGSAQLIPVSGQYQWWRPSYCFSRWAALSSPQSPASVGHWLSRRNIQNKKKL